MARLSMSSPARFWLCSVGAGLIILYSQGIAAQEHPLDPLSEDEIRRAVVAIASSGRIDRSTRVALFTLAEPDKAQVLNLSPGTALQRAALAVVRTGDQTHRFLVDLSAGVVTDWAILPGAQPAIQSEEWAEAQSLVKADPRWQAAVASRGYTTYDTIFCDSLSAGYFADPGEVGRRLLRMPCYETGGALINVYSRPIEGLIAVVDLGTRTVLDVIDDGVVKVPSDTYEFGSSPEQPSAPLSWSRTDFEVHGRQITWDSWRFHLGFDQRFGPVISLVQHHLRGEAYRSVLYQGHISEIFVPYMKGTPAWNFRTYLDAGEFGLGRLASPLHVGTDCPSDAFFLDATLASFLASPVTHKRVMCVFQRDTDRPLWRHYEALTGAHEAVLAHELVVRSIASVAHYDYVIDWVFTQAGEIRIDIGATGIDSVEALKDSGTGATAIDGRGSKVAPDLRAVNHDHYFAIRLDLDIDGTQNRFITEQIEQITLPEPNRRRSLWRTRPEPLQAEAALTGTDGRTLWRIENPSVVMPLGHHSGYQIITNAPAALLSTDDWPQRRAGFSGADLWVTKLRPGELFAAGPFPNQSPGEQGLPYYADSEPLEVDDLIIWPILGFRHVTRPEDWPVLPTLWQSVLLRPYGFFDRNPSLARPGATLAVP